MCLFSAENINRPAAAQISSDVRDHLRTLFSSRSDIDSVSSLYSLVNQRRTSSPLSTTTTTSSDNAKYTNRASICSMRKFPGETPVKDLEPTLKMIIIKELSRERVDGKFAKAIRNQNNSLCDRLLTLLKEMTGDCLPSVSG